MSRQARAVLDGSPSLSGQEDDVVDAIRSARDKLRQALLQHAPADGGESVPYAVQVHTVTSNSEGVWLRIANPNGLFGEGQCWCLQKSATGIEALELLMIEQRDRLPIINAEAQLPEDVVAALEDGPAPKGAKTATCSTPSQTHLIRAGPSLEAIQVGSLRRGQRLYYTHTVQAPDGIWLALHDKSREAYVDRNMRHLDAFTLQAPATLAGGAAAGTGAQSTVTFFDVEEPEEAAGPAVAGEKEVPEAYALLHRVPLPVLQQRAFVLEYLSNQLLPLLPLLRIYRRGLRLAPGVDQAQASLQETEEGAASDDAADVEVESAPDVASAAESSEQENGTAACAAGGDERRPAVSPVAAADSAGLVTASNLDAKSAGACEPLELLQTILLPLHKERAVKSVVQRTMTNGGRVGITLNRVQIPKLKNGLAGPCGRHSVFAQAARELRKTPMIETALRLPQRCWKVRFVGEGVDDAGGGYSESISEMCDELVNGSLSLLVRTPNGREENGDNRDTFLLNPAATSEEEMEFFEFLGVLMGIAIRTNR
jgi:hypothetical protein